MENENSQNRASRRAKQPNDWRDHALNLGMTVVQSLITGLVFGAGQGIGSRAFRSSSQIAPTDESKGVLPLTKRATN